MDGKSLDQVAEHLEQELERRYSGTRLLKHIHSVARFARKIAGANRMPGEGAQKAFVAGLAHDLYKGWSRKDLREHISRDNVPIDELSLSFGGGLLHAPPAAHYLRTVTGLRDRDILDAVYYHTTGRADSTLLGKILFCADYLDPSREIRQEEPDVQELSAKVLTHLEDTYPEIVSRKLSYTIARGKPLHPSGVAAWNQASLQLSLSRKPVSG